MAGDGGVSCADRPALSLLPRTFSSQKVATIASEGSEEQELQAMDDFFASAILGSSMASTEEAKDIPSGVGDPSKLRSEDGHRAGVTTARDQARRRRPALGRKRAHFSFNPNVSDSHLNMDLKSSVDHIEDPDELFSAFENIECARKELKKQMGEVALDSSPNVQWEAARKRRPGILGRKSSYKHHFPVNNSTAEILVPSHTEKQAFSPSKSIYDANSNGISQQLSQSATTHEATTGSDFFVKFGGEGPIDDKEKGVDKLLATLLHSFEDIDKGEEVNFLQERLKIMSTNVEKISLPPLDGFRVKDVLRMGSKLAAENFGRSSTNRGSPTVASSPLAAISVLKRRISQIDPLQDPFSVFYSNEKPSPVSSSPDESSRERSLSSSLCEHPDVVGMEVENISSLGQSVEARCKLSHKGKEQSTCAESDKVIPTSTPLGGSEDVHCVTNGITDHSAVHASAVDMTDAIESTSFNSNCEDNARVVNMHIGVIPEQTDHGNEELPSGTPVGGSIEPSAGLCERMDLGDGNPDNENNIGAFQNEVIPEHTDHGNGELPSGTSVGGSIEPSAGLCERMDLGDGNPDNENNIDAFQNDCVVEDKVCNGEEAPTSGQSSGNAASDIPNDECSGNSSVSSEQNDKENQMDLPASINAPLGVKAPQKRQNRQGKGVPRHSLAGAGMEWQSGVKRSTRIRMKPLEYWRGERPLYARIHDSLPTLVGVKYSSPVEAGRKQNPVLKVKSYVSEEFAGLVQKIALH